jgi:hypothetical protein
MWIELKPSGVAEQKLVAINCLNVPGGPIKKITDPGLPPGGPWEDVANPL